MKRTLLMLLLLSSVVVTGLARADVASDRVRQILRQAQASVVVPVEWDGIWDTVDTSYTCAGVRQDVSASVDTICGGKDYTPPDTGSPISFSCSGTADATTIDMTCTGSGEVFTDCNADFVVTTHGTRTADTYFLVTTVDVSYSGTGTGCSFLPPSCTQFNSHGTRTGPAPALYCSTPARQSTWGRVKLIYR